MRVQPCQRRTPLGQGQTENRMGHDREDRAIAPSATNWKAPTPSPLRSRVRSIYVPRSYTALKRNDVPIPRRLERCGPLVVEDTDDRYRVAPIAQW